MNIEAIRATYGNKVANGIQKEMDYAIERDFTHKIIADEPSRHMHKIYVLTDSYVASFTVYRGVNMLDSNDPKIIYKGEAMKVLELMEAMENE